MEINGIKIDGDNIIKAIEYNYPNGIIHPSVIKKNKIYNYLILFGIRISTCDTSMTDDMIGGVRLKKSFLGDDYWEVLLSDATTDPSPFWLQKPMPSAKSLGGTAWVKEGQYKFALSGDYYGYPSFRPTEPIPVYRWQPTQAQVNDALARKTTLGKEFELAKINGKVKLGTSPDTLIHRTWRTSGLVNESAGCQVFADNGALITLSNWAKLHIKLYKNNSFVYTLLSKEEFTKSNETSKFSYNIIKF